jgi:hypothetical protein
VFNERHGERFITVLMCGKGMLWLKCLLLGLKTLTLALVKSSFAKARATKIGIPPYRNGENGIGASLSATSNESGLVAGRCKEWETLSTGITAQGPPGEIDTLA